jgi:hypothetical protein
MEFMQQFPDDDVSQRVPARLGRRDLMRLGAGALAVTLTGRCASAQQEGAASQQIPAPPPGSPPPAGVWRPHTGPGYKNEANRLGGNGPMDDSTRKIVKFVNEFKESDMTTSVVKAVNRAMVDSMASTIAGFTR